MIEDGRDKGPFWGEKKRYPTALTFNPQDEAHVSFLMAATCLLAVSSGGLPPKVEGDDSWLMEYRDPNWLRCVANILLLILICTLYFLPKQMHSHKS